MLLDQAYQQQSLMALDTHEARQWLQRPLTHKEPGAHSSACHDWGSASIKQGSQAPWRWLGRLLARP